MATASDRLKSLGIQLPPPPRPAGTYTSVVRSPGLAWVSGQIVLEGGRIAHPGLVDRDVSIPEAQALARQASLQGLSALAHELGSLAAVRRPLRVGVFVASSPGFDRQHEVANGATDVLVELFGSPGRPARTSVGVPSLPLNAPVEVDLVFETV